MVLFYTEDVMSLIATGLATAKTIAEREAIKAATSYLKEKVIGRWSEYRANKFLSALIEEVRKERDVKFTSADLNDMLNSIASSEKQTSALFDAYRRVALSASKDMGPMIIGLLTAEVILDDRDPTDDEELIFEAAETLKDRDFELLDSWLGYAYPQAGTELDDTQGFSIIAKSGPEESGGISMLQMAAGDQTPLDIAKDVGPFAVKLKNIGLLGESVAPRTPGKLSSTRYLVLVSPACRKLHRLSIRAKQAANQTP